MSRIVDFLSEWTVLGEVLAAFNQSRFEKMAARRRYGPRGWGFLAAIGRVMAVGFTLGACVLAAAGAEQPFLETYGVEATGVVNGVSFHMEPDGPRMSFRKAPWKRVAYGFTTLEGEPIKGVVYRPVRELSNFPKEDRFTVLYWEWFPSVNWPREVRRNSGEAFMVSAILLFFALFSGCLSRRMFRWRRLLLAATPVPSGAAPAP